MALLLNSPDEQFYVREIAKLLRKNPSGVKRELDKLEEMGIVVSEKVANLKYFQADRNSSLFSELKDLIAKSLGLPGALRNLLRANGVKSAFIYGPYAEGEDPQIVDIIVIGQATPTLLIGLQDMEKKFGKKINCNIMDEAEYKAKKKNDSGLKKVLAEKRITLMGRA